MRSEEGPFDRDNPVLYDDGKSFESSFVNQVFVFDRDNPYLTKDGTESIFDCLIHLKKHEELPIGVFDRDNPEAIIERISIFDRDSPRHFDSDSIKRVGVFDRDNPHQSTLKRIGVFNRDTTVFFPFRKMRSFFYLPTIMRSLYL